MPSDLVSITLNPCQNAQSWTITNKFKRYLRESQYYQIGMKTSLLRADGRAEYQINDRAGSTFEAVSQGDEDWAYL